MVFLLPFLVLSQSLYAETPERLPSLGVLTCSPGAESYSLYGHTALRYCNPQTGEDVVFNYGLFDFSSPNFVWRFVLGQTDYMVGAQPTVRFLQDYEAQGREVTEQVLNLTTEESGRLLQFLLWNIRPENRTYRYNYLTNNCATCVLDAVEAALDGTIQYPREVGRRTYRGELHRFTREHPWAQLGNDLLLGADCDTLLSPRAVPFLPYTMAEFLDSACVVRADGQRDRLVAETRVLVPLGAAEQAGAGFPVRPAAVAWLFAALCLCLVAWEWRRGRVMWPVDALLFLLQGLAGCLILFMLCFSEHPTVDSNLQVLLLNPLPLLCLPWVIVRARKRRKCLYHPLNVIYLLLFLIFSLLTRQQFAEIIIPLSLGIAVRSASHWINTYRTHAA